MLLQGTEFILSHVIGCHLTRGEHVIVFIDNCIELTHTKGTSESYFRVCLWKAFSDRANWIGKTLLVLVALSLGGVSYTDSKSKQTWVVALVSFGSQPHEDVSKQPCAPAAAAVNDSLAVTFLLQRAIFLNCACRQKCSHPSCFWLGNLVATIRTVKNSVGLLVYSKNHSLVI